MTIIIFLYYNRHYYIKFYFSVSGIEDEVLKYYFAPSIVLSALTNQNWFNVLAHLPENMYYYKHIPTRAKKEVNSVYFVTIK